MDHPTRRHGAVACAVPADPARARLTALITAFALALALLVTGAVTAQPAAASTNAEDAFTAKLNAARAARGIPKLTTRSDLVAVAREWAVRMASQTKLFHNPDLTSDVNNWRWVGENVGYGPDAAAIHVAFMDSPGHRANILDRDYTEVGVGTVFRDGRLWVAEVFRQPLRVTHSTSRSTRATYDGRLTYGSTGPAVKRVQARLGVRQSGFYNRQTKSAVSRFQKSLGWQGRGAVGRQTWARLF